MLESNRVTLGLQERIRLLFFYRAFNSRAFNLFIFTLYRRQSLCQTNLASIPISTINTNNAATTFPKEIKL